jgi:hypothetical protein
MTDASRVLPKCATAISPGASCVNETDTANPTMPVRVSATECFACPSNGQGTDWKCNGSSWEAAGVFSCSP